MGLYCNVRLLYIWHLIFYNYNQEGDMKMREKIYRMVHVYEGNKLSVTYKYFMIFFIALSILPLVTKENYSFFSVTEIVCLVVFVIDYFFRWITADFKLNKKEWTVFLKYPLRLISIIDLLSVVALPAGIITAEYLNSLKRESD